jgi:hypothetical protein
MALAVFTTSIAWSQDVLDRYPQTDLIDLGTELFQKAKSKRTDSSIAKPYKFHFSGIPAAGYTLQTGFAGLAIANAAFITAYDANVSTILASFTYTVRNQIILPLQVNFWTKGNKYNIITDWRYLKFPCYTYGLGGYSGLNDGYTIDYSAIRLHQTLMRKVTTNMYLGLGYNYDFFYNFSELNPPSNKQTDLQQYGLSKTETASGITINYLLDSRKNSLNPKNGAFINVIYRPNLTGFGNVNTWFGVI